MCPLILVKSPRFLVYVIYIIYAVVDCGPLSDPLNGNVDVNQTVINSTATYTCLIGYILSGDNTRICQADGVWSGSEPTCEGIHGNYILSAYALFYFLFYINSISSRGGVSI